MAEIKKERLLSLDVLRGADLFFLLILGPVLRAIVKAAEGPLWLGEQLQHVKWEGFVAWDIIMPLFLFMSGITIPFSLAKYRQGLTPDKGFYLKLLRRLFLLFLLGWLVQGNLLEFQWKLFHPYANTLQAIAVGYVVTALLFVHCRPCTQILWCVGFFTAYLLAFILTGMSTDPQDNVAMWVDKAVLGAHRDGVRFLEDGSWVFRKSYQYTWILSSLNFIVTVFLGSFTGQMLRGPKEGKLSNTSRLLVFGAALVAAGLLLNLYFPIIKKIWSSSMTLYSGGICVLLMALFYFWIDVRGHKRHWDWLRIFGMNSIAAYTLGELVDFSSIPKSLFFGFSQWLGPWYDVLLVCGEVGVLFLILYTLYKLNVFLKV